MRTFLIVCVVWSIVFATERPLVPRSSVVEFGPELVRGPHHSLDDAGPNVRMNQDTIGRRQNEITMAAWIANPRFVMGGSNDYRNTDASGGFYLSLDGGYNFADVLVTRGPVGVFEAAGDPVAAIDRTGRMYANYIAFDRTTDDGGLYVQNSNDSGQTWSAPVPIAEHIDAPGADFEDKPYACCDLSLTSPYLNTHYVTWTRFEASSGGSPIFISRSNDGGASYSAPLRVSESDACQFSCPATGPNGEAYVVFVDYWTARIKFDKSLDGGNTWGTDVTVAQVWDLWGQANPCGTFRTPSYPMIACDISGGPRHGWIYVCWVTFSGTDPDLMISHSTNGGTTWSAPTRVDDGPAGTWQWWQWLSVHPETGDLGVGWLDRRDDPNGCLYLPYATVSTDGISFAPSFPLSSVQSNPTVTNFLGDYNGATFRHDGGFYYGWVDTRNDTGDAFSAWFRLRVPAPQGLVIFAAGADARLDWNPVEGASYEIWRAAESDGPYNFFVGATADTFILDANAFATDEQRFYVVKAVAD